MEQKKKNDEDKKDFYLLYFIGIAGLFILITLQYQNILQWINPDFREIYSNAEERGQFGDAYGALNSLFSGLALSGVIISIVMQRKELKLQREEMKRQRQEMSDSRYEYKLNRVTNLIYLQVDRFQNCVNQFNFKVDGRKSKGNLATHEFYLQINRVPENISVINENNFQIFKNILSDHLAVFVENENEIHNLILSAVNCLNPVEWILKNNNLNPSDKNQLTISFISNVGITNRSIFKKTFNTLILFEKHRNLYILNNEENLVLNRMFELKPFLHQINRILNV